MSRAALSIFCFGLYMLGQGALLLTVPNFLLGLFGFAPSLEFWPRAVGISLCVLGGYYVLAARAELVPFFRWTVLGRSFQLLCFAACVLAGLVSARILATAGVEFLSGLWTWQALRASRQA
jgi:hypothetical protein